MRSRCSTAWSGAHFSSSAVPTTAFTLLETKAWDDYKAPSNMLSIPPYLTTKRSDRMHYTKEVKAWEKIMTANAFVWGPMFLMGLFALSDLLRQTTARYIQHMLSNWMLPATLYSYYLLLDVSIDTGKAAEYFKFAGFFLVSFISVAGFYTEGTNAMYFLLDGKSKYADPELVPSLFYLLNWSEHTEALITSRRRMADMNTTTDRKEFGIRPGDYH
eukprot:CAMPEP_0170472914 /NCGR_PEP_ID=MMETSP0123-20130129/14889_1 /TAXON_ID=182087 /ORGANISM="Favella ehrenbergii, Strain Fehren 1" /LENGTH=215 /DNA_ID=CAMNT_0010741549 /DNA_START=514 /DNA_END=1161 /DNA_ORIENTATION=+